MSTDKHSLDPNIEDQDQNDKNPSKTDFNTYKGLVYTKTEVDTRFSSYYTKAEIDTMIDNVTTYDKVTIDNKYYIIGSDTPFFILMNEIGEPEIGLRHLYENVGITKLYYQLEKGTTFGAIKNAPDRFNLDKFFDIIETISTDYHLAFFHVLFLDLIRKKGDIESIFDFSIPDQELEVIALDAAVIEGHNLTGTFACGEFDEVSCNPKNYATLDKIAVDTDNIIH